MLRIGTTTATRTVRLLRFLSSSPSVVELREDVLYPQHTLSFMEKVSANDVLRKIFPPQLCLMSQAEVGGATNVVTHAYYFQGGLAERQDFLLNASKNSKWNDFNETIKPFLQSQHSSLFVEAPLVKEACLEGLGGILSKRNDTGNSDNLIDDDGHCILELRRYYLKLGYDTVPIFLSLYGDGLPSKLESTDPTTSLVTLLYSEVGRLNEVIEIWRHGNGVAAMETSRMAGRGAHEWRKAIKEIADLAIEFRSTIHRPIGQKKSN